MDLKYYYESLGVSYEEVLRRFRAEERIRRYLSLAVDDGVFLTLSQGLEAGNYRQAFMSAHTIKGIAANLSLEPMQEAAGILTQYLREYDRPDLDVKTAFKLCTPIFEEHERLRRLLKEEAI